MNIFWGFTTQRDQDGGIGSAPKGRGGIGRRRRRRRRK